MYKEEQATVLLCPCVCPSLITFLSFYDYHEIISTLVFLTVPTINSTNIVTTQISLIVATLAPLNVDSSYGVCVC
jgi:hypothetical protein